MNSKDNLFFFINKKLYKNPFLSTAILCHKKIAK